MYGIIVQMKCEWKLYIVFRGVFRHLSLNTSPFDSRPADWSKLGLLPLGTSSHARCVALMWAANPSPGTETMYYNIYYTVYLREYIQVIPSILILDIRQDLTHKSYFNVALVVFRRTVLRMGAKEYVSVCVCVCIFECMCSCLWSLSDDAL